MNASEALLGEWQQVRPNPHPAAIVIAFERDGRMRFTIESESVQNIALTWHVDGETLITKQHGAPREEHSRFWFATPDRLVLEKDGESFQYERR